MTWQTLLGTALGFLVVGPFVTMTLGRAGVGPREVLIGQVIGAVVGGLSARALSRPRQAVER